MQRFVVPLDCRQGIGLISEKRWPDHVSMRPQMSTPAHIASDVPAMSLMRIRAARHTEDAHVDDGAGTCKESHANRNVMMVGNASMESQRIHMLRLLLSSTKPRNVSIIMPRCRPMGQSEW